MAEEEMMPSASELLADPLLNGVGFTQAIQDMGPEKVKLYMEGQYAFLMKHCTSLQAQLNELRQKVDDDNTNLVQRVERLLLQMTNHMSIIRQMIDIVASYGDRLTEHEKEQAKQEAAYASLVERQNRFAISLSKLEKSSKDIVEEVADVSDKEEKHSKLEWRVFTVFSIGIGIVVWLLTGDNFVKILLAIKNSIPS